MPVAGCGRFGVGRFGVGRIWCVGRNYRAHALEMGADPDREPPFFFAKPATALVAATAIDAAVVMAYPPATSELHHEVELVVAIGKGGSNIAVADACDHIAGYAVGLDMTRRGVQRAAKAKGRPWALAKGFDQSAPIAPLVAAADWSISAGKAIQLRVNGEVRQASSLGKLIWSVAEVIAQLSAQVALLPGDLIFTGTPAGVGPVEQGDVLRAEIDGLPTLTVRVGS